MGINVIYLDMDGCNADWEHHMMEQPEVQETGITVIEELNKLPNRVEVIQSVYKRKPNFFHELPYIDEFDHILDVVRGAGIEFHFLTCVGNVHHCYDTASKDKVLWVEKEIHPRIEEHAGKYDVITVLNHEDKLAYVSPNSLLIDDYDKNIKQWKEAGGKALHFNLKKHRGAYYGEILKSLLSEDQN